ncbi:MAG: efflux RND transporter permease subunit, partial [Pseudomonadales bacterium]|nr:efflux RND transporter permease subunit [Pseudomonadales bacterium]
DGSRVLLEDVARVELGSENYLTFNRLNGYPASGMSIQLAPGADALSTAELVRATFIEQSRNFPPGYKLGFPNDSTAFIELSIHEVVVTLIEASFLVVLVMFVFLQSWRATLIPAIAVPVVLLGTFGVLAVAGFSVNVLTLFALVLSVGLLVDDAIVVVENVERIMTEEPGISAREATIRSMDQVQTALIAIALVLSAVFLPMAFFGGSVGVIYRQFSITIVSSMVLSVIIALVLSPALAATLLKAPGEEELHGSWFDRLLARFGRRFNAWFNRNADRYARAVRQVITHTRSALVVYACLLVVLAGAFLLLPTSFLPQEDQGSAQLQYTLPPGATQARTLAAVETIENYFLTEEKDNLNTLMTILGQGQSGAGQNAGRGFVSFAPWDKRTAEKDSAGAITQRATQTLSRELRDVQFFALNPPPIRGMGQSSGFTAQLLNVGGLSRQEFNSSANQFVNIARNDPLLTGVRLNSLPDTPTLNISLDDQKVGTLGLTYSQVDSTLSTAWGGSYVGDFIDRGRVKRVYVQGDAPYRSRPEDLASWFVRSGNGDMVPFSSFAQVSWTQAPATLGRFNGSSSFEAQGDAAPGVSSGQAMDRVEEIAASIPGIAVAWSGLSYQERLSGGQAPYLYAISLVVVFLCLAALYESWTVPFSVLLIVPLGLVGTALAVLARGLANDVYFQVGLLTTMGLASKNAILIVEFAEAAVARGTGLVEAAIQAARLRLRPILMTSFAFISGTFPLAVATGAGAQSRIAIGTAVIGGMASAMILAIFFVPMFFVLVRRLFAKRPSSQTATQTTAQTAPPMAVHISGHEARA